MSSEIEFPALNVLVVDDDKAYGRLVERLVRDLGVRETSIAADLDEARAALNADIFDFIFVDRSGDSDLGTSLTKLLRDKSETPAPHVPVIWMVGEGSVENVTSAIKAGADHVVVKPLSLGDIGSTLKGLTDNPAERTDVANYIGPCRRRLPSRVYGPFSGQDRRL